MRAFVGLDVSLASIAICVIDDGGRVVWEGKTLSEPEAVSAALAPWSRALERVGLEAGPTYEWIGASLVAVGLPVACLETRHVKGGTLGDGGEDRPQRCPRHRTDRSGGVVQ